MPQCDATTSTGPCTHRTIPGSPYCRRHTRERDRVTGYRLSDPDLAERAREHAEGALHDLTDQVGLMRALIEQRLNYATDPLDQSVAFKTVTDALVQLTKMTDTLVKLSRESGHYMARSEVEALIDEVIEVVSDELKGVERREEIVDRIVERLAEEE